MNKHKFITDVKQSFMLKRLRAQEECDDFVEELKKDPEFCSLYNDYTRKNIEYLKSKYEQEDVELKHQVQDIKQKLEKYLSDRNIDKSRLNPKYECPICNDTGVVGGRICNCFLSELNKKISLSSSSQTGFKAFDLCDESKLNSNDKKAYAIVKTWCTKYPLVTKRNINIIGGAGTGKTFMLECVANEMLNRNYIVIYKTAFELNELARLYHIGKSYDFADLLSADVVLIDDLGTEPMLKNITVEYLYNLINTRQVHNLPTFISTNLSLENILSRYDERIFSRLANKNLSLNINLTSADKRLN